MEKEPLPPRPACPCPLHGQGEFTALNQYLLAYRHAGRGPGSWKVKSKCERMEQSQKLWGFKKMTKCILLVLQEVNTHTQSMETEVSSKW